MRKIVIAILVIACSALQATAQNFLTPPFPQALIEQKGNWYTVEIAFIGQSLTSPTNIGVVPLTPYSISNVSIPVLSANPINNNVSTTYTSPGASVPDSLTAYLNVSPSTLNKLILLPNSSSQIPTPVPLIFDAASLSSTYGPNLVLGLIYKLSQFTPIDFSGTLNPVRIATSSATSSPPNAAYFEGLSLNGELPLPFRPKLLTASYNTATVLKSMNFNDGKKRVVIMAAEADVSGNIVANKLAILEPYGSTRCTYSFPVAGAYGYYQDTDMAIGNVDSSPTEEVVVRVTDSLYRLDSNCVLIDSVQLSPSVDPIPSSTLINANGGITVLPSAQQEVHATGPFLVDNPSSPGQKMVVVVATRHVGNFNGNTSFGGSSPAGYAGAYSQRFWGVITPNSSNTLSATWTRLQTSAATGTGPLTDFGDTISSNTSTTYPGCVRGIVGDLDIGASNPKLVCIDVRSDANYLSTTAATNPSSCTGVNGASCLQTFRSQYAFQIVDLVTGQISNFQEISTNGMTTTTGWAPYTYVTVEGTYPLMLANIDSDPRKELVLVTKIYSGNSSASYLNGQSVNYRIAIFNNGTLSQSWVNLPYSDWLKGQFFVTGSGTQSKICKFSLTTFLPTLTENLVCMDNNAANPTLISIGPNPSMSSGPLAIIDRESDGKPELLGAGAPGLGIVTFDPASNSVVAGSQQKFSFPTYQNTPFIVDDFDGDGALEVVMPTNDQPSLLNIFHLLGYSNGVLSPTVYKSHASASRENDGDVPLLVPPTLPPVTQPYIPPVPYFDPEPIASGAPTLPPSGVTAFISQVDPLEVSVTWNSTTGDEAFYEVQHSLNPHYGFKTVAEVPSSSHSATVTQEFSSRHTNYYRVVSHKIASYDPSDLTQNPGNPSISVGVVLPSISVPAPIPTPVLYPPNYYYYIPSPPTNVTVTGTSVTTFEAFLTVQWEHNEQADFNGYDIRLKRGNTVISPTYTADPYSTIRLIPFPINESIAGPPIYAEVRSRAVPTGWYSAWSSSAALDLTFIQPNAPTVPTASLVFGPNNPSIEIDWIDSSTNENGFKVQLAASANGPWSNLSGASVLPPGTTHFSYQSPPENQTYFIRVGAISYDNSFTVYSSATAPVVIGDLTLYDPLPPSNLVAIQTTNSSGQVMINLSWADNSNNEANFQVLRCGPIGPPFSGCASFNGTYVGSTYFWTVPQNVTSATDTFSIPLNPEDRYYAVRAQNAYGISSPTNIEIVSIPGGLYTAPTNLTATNNSAPNTGPLSITLNWQPSQVNPAISSPPPGSATNITYNIYSRTGGSGPFSLVGATAATTFLIANNSNGVPLIQPDTFYEYKVIAVYGVSYLIGSSPFSDVVGINSLTVVPPAAATNLSIQPVYYPNYCTPSSYNITWTDNADNESGYHLTILNSVGNTISNQTFGPNVQSYTWYHTSQIGESFTVTLTAQNAYFSTVAPQVSYTVPFLPTAAPSGLVGVLNLSPGSIYPLTLSWTDNSTNESNFVVEQAPSVGGVFSNLYYLSANSQSYYVPSWMFSIPVGATYQYRIRAIGPCQDTYSNVIDVTNPVPTPTPTPSAMPTATPTYTPSPTASPSISPTASATPTQSPTVIPTPAVTFTATPTASPISTPTPVSTVTATPTVSPSLAPTATVSPTLLPTASPTSTPTTSATPTQTPAGTPVPTVTATPAVTPSLAPTATASPTSSPTASPTSSPTTTPTVLPTPTSTPVPVPSMIPTLFATPTPTATSSPTGTPTATPSVVPSANPTVSATPTPSPTAVLTPTPGPTVTPTATPSPVATASSTPTLMETPTLIPSGTATPSVSPTSTPMASPAISNLKGKAQSKFNRKKHRLTYSFDLSQSAQEVGRLLNDGKCVLTVSGSFGKSKVVPSFAEYYSLGTFIQQAKGERIKLTLSANKVPDLKESAVNEQKALYLLTYGYCTDQSGAKKASIDNVTTRVILGVSTSGSSKKKILNVIRKKFQSLNVKSRT